MKKNQKQQKGFVMLFAILATTLILTMTISLSSIAFKEQVLSGTSQESSYADYAADVGIECVRYADTVQHLFDIGSTGTFDCYGSGTIGDPIPDLPDGTTVTQVSIDQNFGIPNLNWRNPSPVIHPVCAKVYIEKKTNEQSGETVTHIVSRGYNVNCADVDASANQGKVSGRILERRQELMYRFLNINPTENSSVDIWAVPTSGTPVIGKNPTNEQFFDTNLYFPDGYQVWFAGQNVELCSYLTYDFNGDPIGTYPISDSDSNNSNGTMIIEVPTLSGSNITYKIECISSIDHSTPVPPDSITIMIGA